MSITTWSIVCLAIVDHKTEIRLKLASFLVLSRLQFGVDGTQIHWILDDVEVAISSPH